MNAPPEKTWADFKYQVSPFRWLETAALTAVIPLLGFAFSPDDPLFVHAEFPWALLGPLLAGLRYGFAHALASSLVWLILLAVSWRFSLFHITSFPVTDAVGVMLTGMVSGEFCDMWTRRLSRLEVVNDYRRLRLDEFTRAYHLLKISHDKLEQRLVGQPHTLRGALMNLRRLHGRTSPSADALEQKAEAILALFASEGTLQVAALHRIDHEGGPERAPVASLGECPPLSREDPVVRKAITTRSLTVIRSEEEALDGSPIAAIPLEDVGARLWAVLAVYEMPFLAFRKEHLHLLAVLGGHIADLLVESTIASEDQAAEGREFHARLSRCISDAKRFRVPSAVVALSLSASAQETPILERIASLRRGLDQEWLSETVRGDPILFMVLPLTDDAGLRGYLARLENLFRTELSGPPEELGVQIHTHQVRGDRSCQEIVTTLRRSCDASLD